MPNLLMNALKCQWVAPPPEAVLAVQKVDPHKLSGPLKIIIISHAQLTRPLDRIEAGDEDGGGHALRCRKPARQPGVVQKTHNFTDKLGRSDAPIIILIIIIVSMSKKIAKSVDAN